MTEARNGIGGVADKGILTGISIPMANELITQREGFTGVLVCSTNLLDNLDPAALRRFAFKVGFKPLSEDGRLVLFKRYFPEVELTIEAAERLSRLDSLTPGYFKAVKTRAHFNLRMDVDGVVEALIQECGYRTKSRPIGFIATTTS